MKILGLYNNICALELFEWIERQGHELIKTSDVLDPSWCRVEKFDLAISYTYRFIISQDIIDIFDGNIVNIHNSYLPWNRGADPNLWSIVDGTPRGVTLHYIDSGLDKGEIISQIIVDDIDDESTLSTTYDYLDKCAKDLFKTMFKYYDYWPSLKKKCIGNGSYHSLKDGKQIKSVITSYDMLVSDFIDKVKS